MIIIGLCQELIWKDKRKISGRQNEDFDLKKKQEELDWKTKEQWINISEIISQYTKECQDLEF